ncbi:PPE domain-containing protein [Qaidamihabitans albus]|uniref:PPE domain-containing protein n=1 Tax=Qaidamihabitans albus TaxID=2795733 RepID=UPI0018F1A42F|nr:PPE domain-containing protein [Qaidamihabitans albus]
MTAQRPYPTHCLPYPWPQPEPEPEDIGEDVDWMTYSHRELYQMATSGLDLEGATDVAAGWSRLGNELEDVGRELRQAIEAAADGWQGAAADQARDTVNRLAGWTEETADGSNAVSGCVSEQAALASRAQRGMPEPPLVFQPAAPGSDSRPGPSEGTTPMSAGGFWTGPELLVDPEQDRQRVRELHRQAAEVMEQYQRESRDLHGRVPSFTSPVRRPLLVPDEPPSEPPGEEPPDDETSASGVTPGGPGAPGAPGGAGVPGGAATGAGQPAMPPSGAAAGEQYGAGARTGVGPGQAGMPAASGPAAASGAARGMGGPAGMPMGGAAAARPGGDDTEHATPSYLQEDDDVWGSQVPVVPPVLGADDPRGGH